MRSSIAVLASGRGSNLKALIDCFSRLGDAASGEIVVVLSNKADAPALDVARTAGIPAKAFALDDDGRSLGKQLEDARADLIVLAGYIKKIPATVVARYAGRIINIHPGLLPKHGGPGMYGSRVHEAVIAAGDRESGVTVHLVDDEYDRGPIIAQWRIPVHDSDTAESLAARVLRVEHAMYPRVVDLVASLAQLGHE